jgi:hypothetical protein
MFTLIPRRRPRTGHLRTAPASNPPLTHMPGGRPPLGYVIAVTSTLEGDPLAELTHATLMTRDQAQREHHWWQRDSGYRKYTICEVREVK